MGFTPADTLPPMPPREPPKKQKWPWLVAIVAALAFVAALTGREPAPPHDTSAPAFASERASVTECIDADMLLDEMDNASAQFVQAHDDASALDIDSAATRLDSAADSYDAAALELAQYSVSTTMVEMADHVRAAATLLRSRQIDAATAELTTAESLSATITTQVGLLPAEGAMPC